MIPSKEAKEITFMPIIILSLLSGRRYSTGIEMILNMAHPMICWVVTWDDMGRVFSIR
jgi:hypothetical protein